jgi:cellulose synthase/poly-beta-1,6-N-acetylglucosamine synthase-like glycosyltransferase
LGAATGFDVVPRLATPYVVLSDANVIYDRQALKWLASRLSEPGVGGVSGKVILCRTTEEFASAESGYYSVEWRLQELGSALHSMVGADGAMYGFRRELFTVCPNDTLIEDFVVALGVVRKGWRMVMEPRALAWEEGPQSLVEEWKRKVRIAAGAAQALMRGNGWPTGAPARFWFLFISHKLLRWLAPLS